MIGDEKLRLMLTALFCIAVLFMLVMLFVGFYQTARVYNWNGRRYCYIGCARIRKEEGEFALRLGERMVDLSHTTLYRICPGKLFCRKNQYRNMYIYAEGSRSHFVIDKEAMKTEIPF